MIRAHDREITRLEVTSIRDGDMIVFKQARAARTQLVWHRVRSVGGLSGQDWLENGGAERPPRISRLSEGSHPMRRVPILVTVWALLATPSAFAQNWVDAVFPERAYDFGNV